MAKQSRPIRVHGRSFETYESVGEYLSRRLSERHHLIRLFEPEVIGRVISVADGDLIELSGDGKLGVVKRRVAGVAQGVGASVGASGFDLVANVEPSNSRLLDRGLGWVGISGVRPPILKFGVREEHGLEDGAEIAARLQAAEDAAVACVYGVLDSVETPPYADRFPEDTSNYNFNLEQHPLA